jgi:hypothetical protein
MARLWALPPSPATPPCMRSGGGRE